MQGTCGSSGSADGATSVALYNGPTGATISTDGFMYVIDRSNHKVRKVDLTTGYTQSLTSSAGPGYVDGNVSAAVFAFPSGITSDVCGFLYVSDSNNDVIRRIANNEVDTIAGDGTSGSNGDGGEATAARLNSPFGLLTTSSGAVIISDEQNHKLRILNPK